MNETDLFDLESRNKQITLPLYEHIRFIKYAPRYREGVKERKNMCMLLFKIMLLAKTLLVYLVSLSNEYDHPTRLSYI